jgi:hypothetical protein
MKCRENTYKVNDDLFIESVKLSKNIHEAIIKMGLNPKGAAYKGFKKRCEDLNLDISHFITDSQLRKRISDAVIFNTCKDNASRQSVLRFFKLNDSSNANTSWLDNKILKLNIDISHWTGKGHLKGKTHEWNKSIPLEEILVENSTYNCNLVLKKKLVKSGLLTYKCCECEIQTWRNQPISLQLEHKNGRNNDNRIENLCFLCPNCHSQTTTFAGRNKGKQ